MNAILTTRNVRLGFALVALGVLIYFIAPVDDSCRPIVTQQVVEGSQGYRVWSGDTLKSFEHGGRKVCIPQGWEPVGELSQGDGWALYEKGVTGVIVRSDAWASLTITPKHSSYTVTVRYPATTPAKDIAHYVNILGHSFTRAAVLFADSGSESRAHTVLITAGLAGNTVDDHTRVYPDPNARLSVFVRTPDQGRAEELINHAIVHLYNRFSPDHTAYAGYQTPFGTNDWQETEATWAESAFSTTALGTEDRRRYLYRVHNAVRTHNAALLTDTPFATVPDLSRMKQGAVVLSEGDEAASEYGHYILAPLIMLSIDGLLITHKAPQHVADILIRIHSGKVTNFMDQVATLLPKGEVDHIRSWIAGTETIPEEYSMRAVDYYEAEAAGLDYSRTQAP